MVLVLSIFVAMTVPWYCPGRGPPDGNLGPVGERPRPRQIGDWDVGNSPIPDKSGTGTGTGTGVRALRARCVRA